MPGDGDNWALEAEAAWTEHDVPYLPRPNRVDLVLSGRLAPELLTRTSFVLPFLTDGTLVMATNRRRGIEFPGGHIDPGEDASAAAIREALEETGVAVVHPLPLGFLRMISDGLVPQGWRYPHPIGFQQFFAAVVEAPSTYVENDECLEPFLLPHADAAAHGGPLSPSRIAVWRAATDLLFANRPDVPYPR